MRAAELSISWMGAPSWLRPEITWSEVVSTSSCLTAGDVVASNVAIAAVPTRMPSSGIAGKPRATDHEPVR